ncbi:hypothetical protein BDN72DRAFT_900340 [Pluteus cervinus]|uniref:Uncharacterized protein n=1 Tax=Pluteus cervinus TaxID=181527 RepID=A0ACD3AJ04_9AGAR|nr:hypothetical protein BDN72DRAFT_900340 [Pluteus cervinus]
MSTGLPLDQFTLLYFTITNTRYALASSYTLTVYEWLLTFSEEVEHIHNMRWCSLKIAFLLCRYYPLISFPFVMWAYIESHPASFCVPIVYPINGLFAPYLIFPQGVMIIRAYAFAGRKRSVLALLASCFVGVVGASIWVFLTDPPVLPLSFYELSGVSGCFPDYGSNVMGVRVLVLEVSAILMDFVSLMVVILHCRRELINSSALARFFLGQGLWAFAAVLVTNVMALIFFFVPHWAFNRLWLPFVSLVCNVIACRVILQLRAKALPPNEGSTSCTDDTAVTLTEVDSPVETELRSTSAWDPPWNSPWAAGEYP